MRSAVVLVVALCALEARADGVALALNLPDDDAVHREFASGIVEDASARWAMLSPQMPPTESATCRAEQACLLDKATLRGASHLLLVGVAGLGARDFVVSVQVFDVKSRQELLAYSDVHAAGADARVAGRSLGSAKLAGVQGLPPAGTVAPPDTPAPALAARESPPTWLGFAGFGLIGAAAAVALTTSAFGMYDLQTRPLAVDPQNAQVIGIGAATAAAVIFVTGVGAIVYDAYVHW